MNGSGNPAPVKSGSPEIVALEHMMDAFRAGPAIYHPSRFWSDINATHTRWLTDGGLQEFKRTLNHSYFQFHISSRSDYFQHILRQYLRRAALHPLELRFLGLGHIGEYSGKSTESDDYRRSRRQRWLYKLYVLALYRLVTAADEFGGFARLNEPMVGQPVVVELGSRRLTQDLCNSYDEYAYIRRTLGPRFDALRTVAEIGAGYGRLIYVLRALHPSLRTTVVDIPPALLVAEWYLREVFPDASAQGFLGDRPGGGDAGEPQMRFLLPEGLEKLPDRSLDLVINVSSFHEMTFDQIERYFELIDRKARFLYLKQWFNWTNVKDKQQVTIMSYPVRHTWKLLNLRLNPLNPRFFEAMYEIA